VAPEAHLVPKPTARDTVPAELREFVAELAQLLAEDYLRQREKKEANRAP